MFALLLTAALLTKYIFFLFPIVVIVKCRLLKENSLRYAGGKLFQFFNMTSEKRLDLLSLPSQSFIICKRSLHSSMLTLKHICDIQWFYCKVISIISMLGCELGNQLNSLQHTPSLFTGVLNDQFDKKKFFECTQCTLFFNQFTEQ